MQPQREGIVCAFAVALAQHLCTDGFRQTEEGQGLIDEVCTQVEQDTSALGRVVFPRPPRGAGTPAVKARIKMYKVSERFPQVIVSELSGSHCPSGGYETGQGAGRGLRRAPSVCAISADETPTGLSTTTLLASLQCLPSRRSKWVSFGVATTTSLMDESASMSVERAVGRDAGIALRQRCRSCARRRQPVQDPRLKR